MTCGILFSRFRRGLPYYSPGVNRALCFGPPGNDDVDDEDDVGEEKMGEEYGRASSAKKAKNKKGIFANEKAFFSCYS